MKITYLELPTINLKAQEEYYSNVLKLAVKASAVELKVQAGETELVFTQADPDFDSAYHFALNIPDNQFSAAKKWIASRQSLLQDVDGKDEFLSKTWNSQSIYFKDAAGNVLEFIARHTMNNAIDGYFNERQILNISEIGLPSEDVISWANELCQTLGISPYKQEPNESFTPVGDDNGLLILPRRDRIWMPDSDVPAKLLPVRVGLDVAGSNWEVRGYPYVIINT